MRTYKSTINLQKVYTNVYINVYVHWVHYIRTSSRREVK